jgi:hypothetical protein
MEAANRIAATEKSEAAKLTAAQVAEAQWLASNFVPNAPQ